MKIKNIDLYLSSYDLVFHYTKRNIALNYILKEQNLKFSERKKTNDPFEHLVFSIDTSNSAYSFFFNTISSYKLSDKESSKLKADIFRIINFETRQISFCKNSNIEKKNDRFGFLKPRMWAQYGENYKGVCLAFDRKELLNEITNQFKNCIYTNDVFYKYFSEMEDKTYNIINTASNEENDYDYYYKTGLEESINQIFFTKHIDYEHENEFRIVKSTNTNNFIKWCSSLKAIFINEKYFMKTKIYDIVELSKKYNIPIFVIIWNYNHIDYYMLK